jgi:hypothetical protein
MEKHELELVWSICTMSCIVLLHDGTRHTRTMKKHELELVTSTCKISCNVLLLECIRHTRTLPLLTNLLGRRDADLRGLSSFTESVTRTQECALGERA